MAEIELLFFDGCPSWQAALENLRRAIAGTGFSQVRLVEVTTPRQARDEHFLGSPSIRIDGVDLWPETRSRYNLSCRVYQTPDGLCGSPTVDMLRERIRALHAG